MIRLNWATSRQAWTVRDHSILDIGYDAYLHILCAAHNVFPKPMKNFTENNSDSEKYIV
jgi:hypothetical protein